MTSSKEDQKARSRAARRSMKRLSSMQNHAKKEDARRAVHLTAKKAFNTTQISDVASQFSCGSDAHSLRGRLPSFDMSQNSNESLLSQERAVHRGSRRGSFEDNEMQSYEAGFSLSSWDLDQTTITSARTSSPSDQKGTKRKWTPFRRRRKPAKKGFLTAEITQQAWMCGVCAKSFSSLEAAEKHEDYHIKEVVEDLGWGSDANFSRSDLPVDASLSSDRKAGHVPLNAPASSGGPDVQKRSGPTVSFDPRTPGVFGKVSSAPEPPEVSLPPPALRATGSSKMSHVDERGGHYLPAKNAGRNEILLPTGMREYVVLADEALVDVCGKAQRLILTHDEVEAELELEWLAKDKSFYDLIAERALKRQSEGAYSRFRTEGKTILNKVQNKFVDAYQLMKEGNAKGNASLDHYNRKAKGDADTQHVIVHNSKTLYVNVIVKNSIRVVSNELERLAKQRWEDTQTNTAEGMDVQTQRFQKFRALAQGNLVKLAGLALASDFTPRRIAVQLSNDLYRLLTPRLKRRGVTIETEIEYRVGPYFVLAVNIKTIDWRRLVKMTYRDVAERKSKWTKKRNADEKTEEQSGQAGVLMSFVTLCYHLSRLTKYEVLAQVLAWLYWFHWIISTPICFLLYHLCLGSTFRTYFLSSVADEIFFYVEEKGMEMEVDIREASTQAAFMLSALRELRADGRELKKKRKESESASKGTILGPLLGPQIKQDAGSPPPKPDGFDLPDNLEFVGLELDLPVGFRRLRWAILHTQSKFITEGVFRSEAKYDNVTMGAWSKHDDHLGLPSLPENIKDEDLIDAEKEMSYLMPKSAFVKANMCYETAYVEAYNDYCFSLKKKALTPEVPYGSTFVAWTKYVVINTGSESCKMICSVEAEFPNGPPLVSRQIKSGMRAGVAELFVQIGETITKYSDEYP